jgi:hypothetical protein
MRRFRLRFGIHAILRPWTAVILVAAALHPVAVARQQVFAKPNAGQSQDQQSRDRYE